MSDIKIRKVILKKDVQDILNIYKYYVEKTAITFESIVPSLETFTSRIEKKLSKYPFIVAELQGELVGYACTNPFVGRDAYDWSVETTIYLKPGVQGKGLGRKLYDTLERICQAQHIINLYACIGYPVVEDEYLTNNSKEFHEHLGYKWVGLFDRCGYKFNRWYHMIWMEKMIGEHPPHPEPVIPFSQFSSEELSALGVSE